MAATEIYPISFLILICSIRWHQLGAYLIEIKLTMKKIILHKRTCLKLVGTIILLTGISIAAVIYQTARNNSTGAIGYEMGDGNLYPIRPEDSKQYRHNLEVYGGKLNVMMDDFNRWFSGLWHGKSLAIIIGATTVLISLGFFYAANSMDRNNPEG